MNILVTSGATREPIDKVRFITNMSSGRTGAAIADEFLKLDHKVTYLHGEGATLPSEKAELIGFTDFQSLDKTIKTLMKDNKFDVVIHAAAVSDYSVDEIVQDGQSFKPQESQKLKSDSAVEIKLRPNHKILNRLKDYVPEHEPMIVGFKLTCTEDEHLRQEAIEKLFENGSVDLVVHNDLKQIEEEHEHRFHVHSIFKRLGTYSGPVALAQRLHELILEVL